MRTRAMKRREFITLMGGAAAWSLAAAAQQPAERMRRIGILEDERWPPIDSLKQGLRNLGYVEGQNLEVVYRFAAGQAERYPGLAAELVALPVELIVALGTPASVAAKRATEAIPIVVQTGARARPGSELGAGQAVQAHLVPPSRHGRKAVGRPAAAAAELDRDRPVGVLPG